MSQPTNIRMTRIVYSVLSLLMLTMGAVAFDLWGNMLDIPGYDSDEMVEESSWCPVRHIRHDPEDLACNCGQRFTRRDLGPKAHPRILVSHECVNKNCTRDNKCRELSLYIKVSTFSPNISNLGSSRLLEDWYIQDGNWKVTDERISIRCERVTAEQQKS